jgi:hypothetical protein
MNFSFFAEGSFYFEKLGLSPTLYGATFVIFGLCQMISGQISKNKQGKINPLILIKRGIILILFANLLLLGAVLSSQNNNLLLIVAIISHMIRAFGTILVASNALAQALVDYKRGVGTASSIFGAYYYGLVSLFTLLMAFLHNGSLMTMPLYFLILTLIMFFIEKFLLQERSRGL